MGTKHFSESGCWFSCSASSFNQPAEEKDRSRPDKECVKVQPFIGEPRGDYSFVTQSHTEVQSFLSVGFDLQPFYFFCTRVSRTTEVHFFLIVDGRQKGRLRRQD